VENEQVETTEKGDCDEESHAWEEISHDKDYDDEDSPALWEVIFISPGFAEFYVGFWVWGLTLSQNLATYSIECLATFRLELELRPAHCLAGYAYSILSLVVSFLFFLSFLCISFVIPLHTLKRTAQE
jgi:hypothetical protein